MKSAAWQVLLGASFFGSVLAVGAAANAVRANAIAHVVVFAVVMPVLPTALLTCGVRWMSRRDLIDQEVGERMEMGLPFIPIGIGAAGLTLLVFSRFTAIDGRPSFWMGIGFLAHFFLLAFGEWAIWRCILKRMPRTD